MSKSATISRRDLLKTAGVVTAAAAASTVAVPEAEAAKGKRWAMVIDLRKCIGCRTCTVACKSENGVSLGRFNAVVKQVDSGGSFPDAKKSFLPRLCNHCSGEKGTKGQKIDIPPCVEKCPEAKSGKRMKLGKARYRTGATYKRPDGMILYDMKYCIGCYKCIKACPYGVRYKDPFSILERTDAENPLGIGKCTYCSHRVDKGVEPSCVNACTGRARIFGDMNDSGSAVAKLIKKHGLVKNRKKTTARPDKGTAPNTYYIDPDGVLGNYKLTDDNKDKEFMDVFV